MGNHICKDDITPARLNYLIYVNIRNPELCKQQLIFVCGIFESKLVLEFTLCVSPSGDKLSRAVNLHLSSSNLKAISQQSVGSQ